MNILETIVEHKKMEIEFRKSNTPDSFLQREHFYSRQTISLKSSLMDGRKSGIIAEFKRKSPSKGTINEKADLLSVTSAYTNLGASGLSILTDEKFFGGQSDDIRKARIHSIPILRKDFIIDEYQVHESRAIGADLILLIAACLSPDQVRKLAILARGIGLETLLEIHNQEELSHICDEVDLIGINNRDLKTFDVDMNQSIELAAMIPRTRLLIAESGINDIAKIHTLKNHGFSGFLIGEHFMKEPDPSIAFARFVNQLNKDPYAGKSLRHDATRSGQETG